MTARPKPLLRAVSALLAFALLAGAARPVEAWDHRWQNNGRCDDARYETSHGGRARAGTDEYDCSRYGNGLKRGADRHYGGRDYGHGYGDYGYRDPGYRDPGYRDYGYRDDDDDFLGGDLGDGLGAAAIVLGGLAVLGALGALGGSDGDAAAPGAFGPGASSGGAPDVVWNDPPPRGGDRGAPLLAEALSACQTVVRDGLAERFGTPDVSLSGDPDEGVAVAAGRAFNYRCSDGRINVWE
jgi:hypothetical protein